MPGRDLLGNRWSAVEYLGAVLVEVCDEPEGTLDERFLSPHRRVCSVCRAGVRVRGHSALACRMGVLGDLLRRRSGDRTVADPRRSRTPGREALLPDTERTTTLGQGVPGYDHAALCCLADLDALGRCEVRVVGGTRLATDLGSLGTRALVLHRVLDLPGERVSRPGGETARGAGSERGEDRPVPVREASHVFEHVYVLSGNCTPAGFVEGPPVLQGAFGSTRLENHPRRPDAKERTGRVRRVRAEREAPAHPPPLVSIHPASWKGCLATF